MDVRIYTLIIVPKLGSNKISRTNLPPRPALLTIGITENASCTLFLAPMITGSKNAICPSVDINIIG